MNDETARAVEGIPAGEIAVGQRFKKCFPDSQGYTLTRIEPGDEGDIPAECILAYNAHADCVVHGILKTEVVYPITEQNRTSW